MSGVGGGGGAAGSGTGGEEAECVVQEGLPACVFLPSCAGSAYFECTVGDDCSFVFQEPVAETMTDFHLGCTSISSADWVISDDRKTVVVFGAACEHWHSAGELQVVMESVHSCLL